MWLLLMLYHNFCTFLHFIFGQLVFLLPVSLVRNESVNRMKRDAILGVPVKAIRIGISLLTILRQNVRACETDSSYNQRTFRSQRGQCPLCRTNQSKLKGRELGQNCFFSLAHISLSSLLIVKKNIYIYTSGSRRASRASTR